MINRRTFFAIFVGAVVLFGLAPHGSTAPVETSDSPGRAHDNSLDQGGETCETATVITALPFSDDGTTTGYTDDYDYACPYLFGTAPDVVYSYTPPVDQFLSFTLCWGSTDYDTKLYIYENVCSGTPIACNDNACSSPLFPDPYVSRLDGVPLTGGVTYYVVVDGYGTDSGNYTLQAVIGLTCFIQCPPDFNPENEPECADDYEDHHNGGCGSVPIVFDTLECGETVCATTGTFLYNGAESRDTDWYLLELPYPANLSWSLHGDYPLQGMILRAGVPNPCEGFQMLAFSSGQCSTTVTAEGLLPRSYFLWTGPAVFTGVPCGTMYWGQVTCSSALDSITDLTVCPVGLDMVLRWSASPFATYYRIYTSPTSGEPWSLLDSATATTYTHVAPSEAILHYDVRACAP